MARDQKIFIEVDTSKVRDEAGAVFSASNKPYISSKEAVNLIIQYCTNFISVENDSYDVYTGFAGQSITSSAVIDNDFNKVDKGSLVDATLSGTITSVTISGLANTPQPTGTIQLINGSSQSDLVPYTAAVSAGDDYTFTIDSVTLNHSYVAGDQANTNDPALIKTDNSGVDQTDKDTGLFQILLLIININWY